MRILSAAAALALTVGAADAAGYRSIVGEVTVPTDAVSAWRLWTTDEGFKSFFPGGAALETNIELRPGGPFEVFMIPGAPEGARGCDGCTILGYEEGRMISFTWTNRPDMAVRPHRTHVVVSFDPVSEHSTRVTLVADGWGAGPDWDAAYAYFSKAWVGVLQSYRKYVESGLPEIGRAPAE